MLGMCCTTELKILFLNRVSLGVQTGFKLTVAQAGLELVILLPQLPWFVVVLYCFVF
jgi:hypothetical protein